MLATFAESDQLLINPTTQHDAAINGFKCIPFLVHRYRLVERLRISNKDRTNTQMPADIKPLLLDLEGRLIQLYCKILQYQIRLLRHTSHGWVFRYGRAVAKVDDWAKMLAEMQTLDSECSSLAQELGQEELEAMVKVNHGQIDDFSKAWNADLQLLRQEVIQNSVVIDASLQAQQNTRLQEEALKCLQSLRINNPYENQKNRTPCRSPGTCLWFLDNKQFHTWRASLRSSLLWVSANPGCGKSVLSRSLFEEKLVTLDADHATICYFFFKDISPDSRSICKAMSAILHQTFTQKPELVEHALPAFAMNGSQLPTSFHVMWDILITVAADPKAGEIVCILDAIDECEEGDEVILIDTIKGYYGDGKGGVSQQARLRFLLTSRPYRKIETRFHSLVRQIPTIHLSGDEESSLISEEINIVIRSEVSAIASERGFDTNAENFLLQQLLQIKNRTYLWLHLTLDQIRNSERAGSVKGLRKEIESLPQSVGEAYETLLSKTKDRSAVIKMLQIIVGATAPLTLQELNVAMSMETGYTCYDDLELESPKSFQNRIKQMCGLFVYIHRSRVYLIHQTAKEFLMSPTDVAEVSTTLWKHSLRAQDAEFLLASISVSLLMFDFFKEHPQFTGVDFKNGEGDLDEVVDRYCENHEFLAYAATEWAVHLSRCTPSQQVLLLKDALDLCNTGSSRYQGWFTIYKRFEGDALPWDFTDLTIASYFELYPLVEQLLSRGVDIEAKDGHGATALNRAISNSNIALVRLLLERGADIEANSWVTPWVEETNERGSVLEYRLFSGRPLYLAATKNTDDILRLLLAHGADINAKSTEEGLTALHGAAINGETETLLTLLEYGADVEMRSGEPGALVDVKNYFYGWRINAKIGGTTPIQHALGRNFLGKTDKIKLLREHGADINAELIVQVDFPEESLFNCSSLNSSASEPNRDQEIEMQTVDTCGAKIKARPETNHNNGSESPDYSDASRSSVEPSLQSSRSESGMSLSEATAALHRCFLEISRPTILHVMVVNNDEEMVSFLLKNGARIDGWSPDNPTPLHLASIEGNTAIAKLLIDHGVDINAEDMYGDTALAKAERLQHHDMVKLLREEGADVRDDTDFSASEGSIE